MVRVPCGHGSIPLHPAHALYLLRQRGGPGIKKVVPYFMPRWFGGGELQNGRRVEAGLPGDPCVSVCAGKQGPRGGANVQDRTARVLLQPPS